MLINFEKSEVFEFSRFNFQRNYMRVCKYIHNYFPFRYIPSSPRVKHPPSDATRVALLRHPPGSHVETADMVRPEFYLEVVFLELAGGQRSFNAFKSIQRALNKDFPIFCRQALEKSASKREI